MSKSIKIVKNPYVAQYKPDKWVILKVSSNNETALKVLAGWSGSYLDGQSWKINSGITKYEIEGDYFLFYGYSGSVYKCHKNMYGTNMIMCGIISQVEDNPDVKVLNEEDALKELEGIVCNVAKA
jgi:hypothetical protein